MRVAFFVDQFPSLSETFILNQITGLIDRGHEVDIYCDREAYPKGNRPGNWTKMHPEVTEYQLLPRTYSTVIPRNPLWRCLKGIGLLLVNFWRSPPTILQTLNFWQFNPSRYGEPAEFLKPLYLALPCINRPPYDIIHCHYGRNGLKAALLKDLGVIQGKIVVVFHGNDISRYLQIHGDDIYNYLFSCADLLMPISQHWQDKLISLGCDPNKIMVHHMGIDCHKFIPAPKPQEQTKKLIISVARLVEKKGLADGIDAVAQLGKTASQLVYYIVGDGILRSQLTKQIEQLAATEQIKLLGWLEQSELCQLISQADILLAPSVTSKNGDSEGIPVSLMEAMAQSIPVVSTHHSGIAELVENDVAGYLVPERDVQALSTKLDQLLASAELRQKMGIAGRERVIKDYNIEQLCDRLVVIYQQLLAE
jgi:colanic acid/amylovoran biosynthesis glycosyltransferase